jgi:hypothetical protein
VRPPPTNTSVSASAAANDVSAIGSGSSRRRPSAPQANKKRVCAIPATSAPANAPSSTGHNDAARMGAMSAAEAVPP